MHQQYQPTIARQEVASNLHTVKLSCIRCHIWRLPECCCHESCTGPAYRVQRLCSRLGVGARPEAAGVIPRGHASRRSGSRSCRTGNAATPVVVRHTRPRVLRAPAGSQKIKVRSQIDRQHLAKQVTFLQEIAGQRLPAAHIDIEKYGIFEGINAAHRFAPNSSFVFHPYSQLK